MTQYSAEGELSVDEKYGVADQLETLASMAAEAPESPAPVSLAMDRFRSCRWRKAPENGNADCCAHRDVLPLTGAKGFDAEAWCPDCGFYKLRRTPKKRDDYGLNY